MSVVTWIVANWGFILEVVMAVVGVASLITGMTKTPKDDSVVSTIKRVIGYIAGVTFKDSPGTLKAPGTKADKSKDSFFGG